MTDDPAYLDPARSTEERVTDLVDRMTIEEKAGLVFHTMAWIGPGGDLSGPLDLLALEGTAELIDRGLNHFNLLGTGSARDIAVFHNNLQAAAAETRLGIPVTLSTDPRHAFTHNVGTAATAGAFSEWPESLGLAATRDAALVEQFADIARQEYLAVGIRVALHPQVDLATEPRWSRITGTFGEDVRLTSELAAAYVRGFQGPVLGPRSVATMTKHFPGGGPQLDGEDPHFSYGREQVYPGGRFDEHLEPFKAAIAAGTSQMMPYYAMPIGTEHPEVGFAFNHPVITGLLRERLGFDGIVCTDWGLLTDAVMLGQDMPARAWGLEHLSPLARAQQALDAGVDQFGGEARTDLVIELLESGALTEERLDVSVRRLLREKLTLGLFDERYVDPDRAEEVVGCDAFRAAGLEAQRRSLTVLTDRVSLPAPAGRRLHTVGIDEQVAARYGTITADQHDADLTIVRVDAPYEPRPGGFESMFHAGSLEYAPDELRRLLDLTETGPTVVVITMDRPAVVPELAASAGALVAAFGACDEAVLDVVFGRARPTGRLPFDMPSSTAAVETSRTDVAFDTAAPLFRFGHGHTLPGGR